MDSFVRNIFVYITILVTFCCGKIAEKIKICFDSWCQGVRKVSCLHLFWPMCSEAEHPGEKHEVERGGALHRRQEAEGNRTPGRTLKHVSVPHFL